MLPFRVVGAGPGHRRTQPMDRLERALPSTRVAIMPGQQPVVLDTGSHCSPNPLSISSAPSAPEQPQAQHQSHRTGPGPPMTALSRSQPCVPSGWPARPEEAADHAQGGVLMRNAEGTKLRIIRSGWIATDGCYPVHPHRRRVCALAAPLRELGETRQDRSEAAASLSPGRHGETTGETRQDR